VSGTDPAAPPSPRLSDSESLRSSEMICTSSQSSGLSSSRLCLFMAWQMMAEAFSWLVIWTRAGTNDQGKGPRVSPRAQWPVILQRYLGTELRAHSWV
jgi:hypothetical protein